MVDAGDLIEAAIEVATTAPMIKGKAEDKKPKKVKRKKAIENEDKSYLTKYLIAFILAFAFMHFVFGLSDFLSPEFSLQTIVLIEILVSVFLVGLIIGLEKVGMLPNEEQRLSRKEIEEREKERIKEEKKKIDETPLEELRKRYLKEVKIFDYLKETIDKKEGDKGPEWVFNWVSFGFVVFFMALLFFGSLDGVVFNRTIYVETITSSMDTASTGLANSFGALLDGLEKLIIKLYDLGASKPTLFYWLWIITISYWMGYMFLYKMLRSSWTGTTLFYGIFKELFIAIKKFVVKNDNKKLKGGNGKRWD